MSKHTKETIIQRFNQGEELQFVFFWGHTVTPGKVTTTCFSQWFPCTFTVDGEEYSTAEQYMMAMKAELFGDEEVKRQIMEAQSPKQYKSLGRKVSNFDDAVWKQNRFEIVKQGNIAKFSQNPDLKAFLLKTGDSVLVEASPYDGIWGVRLSRNDPMIQDPNNWKGLNLLGFALMEARDMIREAE